MSLIICIECKKEYSDKAEKCPICACPTSVNKLFYMEETYEDSFMQEYNFCIPKLITKKEKLSEKPLSELVEIEYDDLIEEKFFKGVPLSEYQNMINVIFPSCSKIEEEIKELLVSSANFQDKSTLADMHFFILILQLFVVHSTALSFDSFDSINENTILDFIDFVLVDHVYTFYDTMSYINPGFVERKEETVRLEYRNSADKFFDCTNIIPQNPATVEESPYNNFAKRLCGEVCDVKEKTLVKQIQNIAFENTNRKGIYEVLLSWIW